MKKNNNKNSFLNKKNISNHKSKYLFNKIYILFYIKGNNKIVISILNIRRFRSTIKSYLRPINKKGDDISNYYFI